MAQNTTIILTPNAWTLLTDADITSLTFQFLGGWLGVKIKATVGTTAPANDLGAIVYKEGQGELSVDLADLFPGVVGANRVWAKAPTAGAIMVSHA